MSRRVGSRTAGALVAFCAVCTAIFGLGALPAAAHNNGGATPLIQEFTLTPMAGGWDANVQIVDSDLGTPVRNAYVYAIAGTKQSLLNPSSTVGGYQGAITGVKPGPQQVSLKVRSKPGNDPVNPFLKSWNVTLAAGEPLAIVESSGGGGGSHLGLIFGVTGAVIVLAVLYVLFSFRRRTAAPAQSRAKRA